MYLFIAILMFSFLIFIHEFGHFITAKLFDVRVNEFSIFMGPRLLHWGKGETEYSLRLFPVGGYCAMEGEDGDSDDPRAFTKKPGWQRVIILAAGAFMNFVTGIVILLCLFATVSGFRTLEITGFVDGCPLESEDGFMVGDVLKEIDGDPLYIFADFSMLTERSGEGEHEVTVLRNGEKVRLTLDLTKRDYVIDGETEHIYGLLLGGSEEMTPWVGIRTAALTAVDFVRMVRLGLVDLISGAAGLDDMSGPVGIVNTIQETGKSSATVGDGIQNVIYFCAFIAINLAVMNMLPLPALDGGHIFLLIVTGIIEKITRKKVNPKYEAWIHGAGLALLLLLMAVVTFNDIAKLIIGG